MLFYWPKLYFLLALIIIVFFLNALKIGYWILNIESLADLCYQTRQYASYSECDDEFLHRSLPPNLVPIWLADSLEQVSPSMQVDTFPNNSIAYDDLPDGTQLSDCPLPCTTTSVETRILTETSSSNNISTINLTFSPTIIVTTTSFLKFIFAKFLSDLGGCLGLWLGLSMVQMVDTVWKYILSFIFKKA